ncbi:small ribosomal subunit protein uS11m [Gasterosteus aculeatus]|uniref:Small ribosomal subunit protein uS11m n=1 Tax=Gasterosteus aculeatus aculeatus TaxID=481459 RepID=A0AAQ4P9D4_GASAC|nr:28S ribosomal protein S11, mitochondrial [Gasterosteus aculeatus aculeatus]
MLNMYKLNSVLVSSVSSVCRQLSGSLNAFGSSAKVFIGCESIGLQRTLCTSAVRRQETAASTTSSAKTSRDSSIFPPIIGEESSLRWGGKKFEELPIAHVKATYNNTHIQLTESTGQSMVRTSCGTEGFKNIKKSTPIAAQTAGISAAAKATAKGVKFVRVVVKGLGPGRLSAIKGLTMGGLEVISITDNTPVPHNGCRPRKARRT